MEVLVLVVGELALDKEFLHGVQFEDCKQVSYIYRIVTGTHLGLRFGVPLWALWGSQ